MTGVRLDCMDAADSRGYSSARPLAEGPVNYAAVVSFYLEV